MVKQATSEGYEIFQRPNSSNWYIRFSIAGQGQRKISLRTNDKAEAERLAHAEWYKTVGLAEMGLAVTRKSFETIVEEFIQSIELAVERGARAEYHHRQIPPIIRPVNRHPIVTPIGVQY